MKFKQGWMVKWMCKFPQEMWVEFEVGCGLHLRIYRRYLAAAFEDSKQPFKLKLYLSF